MEDDESRAAHTSDDMEDASRISKKRGLSLRNLYYKMNHPQRGLCIIFNVENFAGRNQGMPSRSGSSVDVNEIRNTFGMLGFVVQLHQDPTTSTVDDALFKASRRTENLQSDCFVCWILSHGKMGTVYTSDGELELKHFVKHFTADSTLEKKPKIFFVQACQAKESQSVSFPEKCTNGEFGKEAVGEETATPVTEGFSYRLPSYPDFLFAFAAPPGYYAFRNNVSGSCFVTYLCLVLRQCTAQTAVSDLVSLLIAVARKMAFEYESKSRNESRDQKKQVLCFQSSLTKKLFLTWPQ
ncbi:caspase-3-like [Ornithodoros turicata]|uniref:caspase-3-like n=1 Tax=Ornithodoros turicata TaxID=34597 RepID=UPI0031391896